MRSIARCAVAVLAIAAVPLAGPALAQHRLGMIELKHAPRERPSELAWLTGSVEPTLRELTGAIDAAAEEALDTLVIRLKDAELNRTQVEEIGAAIKRARAAGKTVAVFSENYDAPGLLLGSYADRVLIQAGGAASLPGLHMEEIYLADTLAWLGVKADLVQIGDYKGANEMFVNPAPSKAWEQNISQLLDSLYGAMRQSLKANRGLTDARLDDALRQAWLADAEEAVAAGLVDQAVDLPGLGTALTGGQETEWVQVPVGSEPEHKLDALNPFAAISELARLLTSKPDHAPKGPTIAVVHIDGAIVDGDSSEGGLFGGEGTVGSRTIRNALEEIRDQDKIRGVVLRIDSPGGSATASEVMWQGVRRVAEKKPVWVSVGSMAASGGFYVAVAGDRIYVNPSSIVGSIGVVGGKFALGGLYEKLKIRVVERSRGPMAALESSAEPWSPEQLSLVHAKMTRTFDLFSRRVAAGRKGIDLTKTAGGWLFAGQKAIDVKMADRVGGLDACIGDLAGELSLSTYDVMHYPGPKGIPELLEDLFGGVRSPAARAPRLAGELVGTLRAAVGERAWPALESSLAALFALRERPVILAMPRALIIK